MIRLADETRKEEQKQKNNITPEEEIFRQRKDKLMRLRQEEGYDPFQQDHWDVKYIVICKRKLRFPQRGRVVRRLDPDRKVVNDRKTPRKTAFVTFEDEYERLQFLFPV